MEDGLGVQLKTYLDSTSSQSSSYLLSKIKYPCFFFSKAHILFSSSFLIPPVSKIHPGFNTKETICM